MKAKSTLLISALIGLVTLTTFQNCAPSHTAHEEVPFSIESVYPYTSKPMYYDNIQLTKVFKDGNKWKYQFVAGVVYADTPTANIDVEINILDENDDILCLSTQARINVSTNHIMIDNCASSHKATEARIKIWAKLASESAFPSTPLGNYSFPLE